MSFFFFFFLIVVAALVGWPLTLVTCVVTCLVYSQVSSTVTLMIVINIKYIITRFAFALYADGSSFCPVPVSTGYVTT